MKAGTLGAAPACSAWFEGADRFQTLFLCDNSVISASSQFGVNGTITLLSSDAPASGKIIPLSQKPLLAALNAGAEREVRGEGQGERREAGGEGETPILSLRQIAPPGFLTQAFAADWSTGCTS